MAKFTVLMSASLSTLSQARNSRRTEMLRKELLKHNSTIVECEGHYKGVAEKSFAIPVNHRFVVLALMGVAREYEQESILVINNETKDADLVFLNLHSVDRVEPLGKWTKTTGWDCRENHDSYTYFPEANVYYVCR